MDFQSFGRQRYTRRTMMKRAAGAGIAVASFSSLSALAACGETSSSGPITITSTDMPDKKGDPNGYAAFVKAQTAFEKANPHYKIKGVPYYFDPSTFYARMVAGKQEDATRVYFTEPQGMIAQGTVADITDYLKQWTYFSSITPAALKIIGDSNNHYYAVPVDGYKQGLVYSRKLFKKAGLDPDKPPLTWDDFMGYAKQISSKVGGGVYGFMEDTTNHTGGWRFTNFLYTAGGRAEKVVNGKYVASFNSPEGVAVLEMYKKMRWQDHSWAEKVIVNDGDPYTALGQGKIAMATGGTTNIADLYNDFKINLEDFGVGPMPVKDPSNKDAGVLGGGDVFIFKKSDDADHLQGAVKWVIALRLDLGSYEDNLKANKASGRAIGYEDDAAFTGAYAQKRKEILDKYATVPYDLTKPYFDAQQQLVPEPPAKTQDYYAQLDPVVQAVLSKPDADIQQLLADATTNVQGSLDSLNV